ncbi:MAG: hypothetical protein R2829_09550 [Bacteroidia bacterium]
MQPLQVAKIRCCCTAIARGDSLSTGFVDETKNICPTNLYDLLDLNDTLRYSDSVLTDFYDSNQLSTAGKLNTVKDYIKQHHQSAVISASYCTSTIA